MYNIVPTKEDKRQSKLYFKSLFIKKDIPKNTKIKEDMLASMRPGKGIPTTKIDQIIGKKAKFNLKKGNILKLNQIK